MITFVVWAIGLWIAWHLASINLLIIQAAYHRHEFLAVLAIVASATGWLLLLTHIL